MNLVSFAAARPKVMRKETRQCEQTAAFQAMGLSALHDRKGLSRL